MRSIIIIILAHMNILSVICHFLLLSLALVSGLVLPSADGQDLIPAPAPPGVEQSSFRLADPGLRIELAAAEPQVASPVAIAWDAEGAVFVAEMIDYPVAPPSGRIRRLEDRDGDGVYEWSSVFAEGLPFPNGVLPSFGGVLVTAAPDILFLRDTDGDGVADVRKVVLTGFGQGNTQLRVNGLFWGLDNWIYAANGRSDGEIRAPGSDVHQTVSIRRRDLRFRFRPRDDAVTIQAIAGFSQFGLAHDDRGNRFPSWNTIPLRHVVLEQATLDRSSFLAETSSVAEILDDADGGRVFSISPVQTRFNRESVDYFNASCGPTIFRGDWMPPAYRGNAFVCEPLTNLVHRRVLEPSGCTFKARRAESGREFLASTDSSFRPVNLATGPDGALYVVDMYRELVEHPDFVPAELRSNVEFRRWHDRGRIWRISARSQPATGSAPRPRPGLARANAEELVRQFNHPVGWVRDTAQRLLVERQQRDAIPFLEKLLMASGNSPGRLHALWTLNALGATSAALLERAAADQDPDLREHALRIAATDPAVVRGLSRTLLIGLTRDPSIRVRLQAAIVLGYLARDAEAVRALVTLARRDAGDPWMRIAILSSLGETSLDFLQEWASKEASSPQTESPDQNRLIGEVAEIVGVRRKEHELQAVREMLAASIPEGGTSSRFLDVRLALAAGLGRGLKRSGPELQAWLAGLRDPKPGSHDALAPLWNAARARVVSNEAAERRRIALEALVQGSPELAGPLLPRLIQADQPPALQAEAAKALGHAASSKQVEAIIEEWSALALGTRHTLLGALAQSPAHAGSVIRAIEDQTIAAVELDAASRDSLLRLADPDLKKSLEAVLARFAPADRSLVVERYQAALRLPGDRSRGSALFAKNCQTCHEHQGKGHRVGPDLSGIAGRPPGVLLSDILHPNRDVAPDSVVVTIATRAGQVLSGLLVEETASSVKLRQAEGVEQTVLRSEIAETRSSGRSLMPEGLEQALNFQEMADLLAFLRSGSR
jgi:putative membrane-bound dehydrogenase-like protein